MKTDLLPEIHMSLMIENGFRVGICHVIYQYVKANNKYMKDSDENKQSLYDKYEDFIKIYFNNQDFIKNYNEDSYIGYFLQVDILCPEESHELHNDLPFLPKRMKTGIFYTDKKLKTSIKSKINV